jgi:inhibitor of KinA sporulation pathway (predicted exonuclease)
MSVVPRPELHLIIDFEATCCDRGTVPRDQMEIIEIGAVLADARTLQPVDEFQSFVRPVRHPVLTPFCRELNSIRQSDVDLAPGFPEVVAHFKSWLYGARDADLLFFCSWGDYDRSQLRQDCEFHRLPVPIGAEHLNVKRRMAERQGLAKKPGLGEALRLASLTFSGTAHRGIDDARNIARLLPFIFGDQRLPDRRRR